MNKWFAYGAVFPLPVNINFNQNHRFFGVCFFFTSSCLSFSYSCYFSYLSHSPRFSTVQFVWLFRVNSYVLVCVWILWVWMCAIQLFLQHTHSHCVINSMWYLFNTELRTSVAKSNSIVLIFKFAFVFVSVFRYICMIFSSLFFLIHNLREKKIYFEPPRKCYTKYIRIPFFATKYIWFVAGIVLWQAFYWPNYEIKVSTNYGAQHGKKRVRLHHLQNRKWIVRKNYDENIFVA